MVEHAGMIYNKEYINDNLQIVVSSYNYRPIILELKY